MKYRRLPLEDTLQRVVEKEGQETANKMMAALFDETRRTRGFQLVVGILRNQEQLALRMLRADREWSQFYLGWIHSIDQVRKLLTSLLPEGEQKVDWADDEEEAFLNVDDEVSGEGEPE